MEQSWSEYSFSPMGNSSTPDTFYSAQASPNLDYGVQEVQADNGIICLLARKVASKRLSRLAPPCSGQTFVSVEEAFNHAVAHHFVCYVCLDEMDEVERSSQRVKRAVFRTLKDLKTHILRGHLAVINCPALCGGTFGTKQDFLRRAHHRAHEALPNPLHALSGRSLQELFAEAVSILRRELPGLSELRKAVEGSKTMGDLLEAITLPNSRELVPGFHAAPSTGARIHGPRNSAPCRTNSPGQEWPAMSSGTTGQQQPIPGSGVMHHLPNTHGHFSRHFSPGEESYPDVDIPLKPPAIQHNLSLSQYSTSLGVEGESPAASTLDHHIMYHDGAPQAAADLLRLPQQTHVASYQDSESFHGLEPTPTSTSLVSGSWPIDEAVFMPQGRHTVTPADSYVLHHDMNSVPMYYYENDFDM